MRVYAEPDDPTVYQINETAKKLGISKADLVLKAIDQFLNPNDRDDQNLDQLRSERDQIQSELDQFRSEHDQTRSERDQSQIKV